MTRGGADARHAAHQHAAPAIGLLQGPGTDLWREPSRDLGHRRQQRQAATAVGHGFIGNRRAARGEKILGLLRIGREVEVGKKRLPLAQHLALHRLRFLDLDDHVGSVKDLLGGVEDLGADRGIVGIGKAGACTGIGLHIDLVAVIDGLLRGGRGHADAEFLRLDLLGAPDFHSILPKFSCADYAPSGMKLL